MRHAARSREVEGMDRIEPIRPEDDGQLARLIRDNLERYGLDLPGTAYFDPELDHLSRYYGEKPEARAYFVLRDEAGAVMGGVGFAELCALEGCAELQKLYLADVAKGKGLGRLLLETAETQARRMGYRQLYLETHSALREAVHLYEKRGYRSVRQPAFVMHTTMDLFFMKELTTLP